MIKRDWTIGPCNCMCGCVYDNDNDQNAVHKREESIKLVLY